MKRVLFTILFLVMVCSVNATDLDYFDLTLLVAADSSDSGVIRDTVYSETTSVQGWEKLSFNWQINLDNDSAFSDDTLFLQLQTAINWSTDEYGTAYDWVNVSGGDETILIGGNDTSSLIFTSLVITDSMFNHLRVRAIYSITLDSAAATDIAGESYLWHVKPWIDRKFK